MSIGITNSAVRTDTTVFASLLVNSHLIALALADQRGLLFTNRAFDNLFGRTGPATGSVLDLLVLADRDAVDAALRSDSALPWICVAEALRGDGETFEVELRFERLMAGGEALLAIFAQDITDRFRETARLNLLAYSDPLTGLGNRAMFADRLRVAVLSARRTAGLFAVVSLDLDGFKEVNDRHGHDVGDMVLQRIAARFLAGLRDTDTVARPGGDEFAVLLTVLSARGDAMLAADRLVELARLPIDLGKYEVTVGASAGIAIYPEHAGTVDHLLAAADRALYVAKRHGRGCSVWAEPACPGDAIPAPLVWDVAYEVGVAEIDEQHARLVALLNDLVAALRNGEQHDAALREVIRYTGFHFACEERLMRSVKYSGVAAHANMHRRLLGDLHGLRLDGTGLSVSLVARYLQEWLIRHVDGADRDVAAALHAAGAG